MNQSSQNIRQNNSSDIRLLLQSELIKRCKINPRYSARAFARSLNIEPSALSKVLSGKRSVTKSSFAKFASALNLSPKEVTSLSNSVKEKRGKAKIKHEEAVLNYSFEQISEDSYQIISDWYHYAILELTTIDAFQGSPRWIAKKLGIGISEVNVAVDRLKRLKLLEIDNSGNWKDISLNATNIEGSYTTNARKQLQKEILAQSIRAVDEVPFNKRDNSSMTMAIDSDLIIDARKLIKDFRRNLCALLQSGKKKDSVYQLSVALIPATNNFNNNKEKDNESKR